MQSWIQLKFDTATASEIAEMIRQEDLHDDRSSLIPFGKFNVLVDDQEALRFLAAFSKPTKCASQWNLQSYLLNFGEENQNYDLASLLISGTWSNTELEILEKLDSILKHPIIQDTINNNDLDFLINNLLLAKDYGVLDQVINSFNHMLTRVVMYEAVVHQGQQQYEVSIISRNINLRDLAAQAMSFIALADLQQVIQKQSNKLLPPNLPKLFELMDDLISAKIIAVYEPNFVTNDQEARYVFSTNTLYFGKILDRPLFTASNGMLLSQIMIHELMHALQDKKSTANTHATQGTHEAEAYFNEVAYIYFKLGKNLLEKNFKIAKDSYEKVWQNFLTNQSMTAQLSSAFKTDLTARIPASFVHNNAYQALQNYLNNPANYATLLTTLADKWAERAALDDIYRILSEKTISMFISNSKNGQLGHLALANNLAISGAEVFLQKETWPLPSGKDLMKASIETFTNYFKNTYQNYGLHNPDLQISFFEQNTEFKRSVLVNFIYQAAIGNIDVAKYFTDEALPKLKWINSIFQDHPDTLGI